MIEIDPELCTDKMTQDELLAECQRRFGENPMNWSFVCHCRYRLVIACHVPGDEDITRDDGGMGMSFDLDRDLPGDGGGEVWVRLMSYHESDTPRHPLFDAIRSRPFEVILQFRESPDDQLGSPASVEEDELLQEVAASTAAETKARFAEMSTAELLQVVRGRIAYGEHEFAIHELMERVEGGEEAQVRVKQLEKTMKSIVGVSKLALARRADEDDPEENAK